MIIILVHVVIRFFVIFDMNLLIEADADVGVFVKNIESNTKGKKGYLSDDSK